MGIGRALLKRLADHLQGPIVFLLTVGTFPAEPPGNAILDQFIARSRQIYSPRVLELGTKQSIPGRSTKHNAWVPHASEYLGTDLAGGEDVDIIADVHRLTRATGEEQFDVIISCSSFEHFKYPHLAAHQVMKALRIGGLLFIQTHQTFPLHSYPYDYFRFSREALAGLFGAAMGFRVIGTGFDFPARVYAREDPGGWRHPAFLNVVLFGEKTDRTPDNYVFEFDME